MWKNKMLVMEIYQNCENKKIVIRCIEMYVELKNNGLI